MVGKISVPILVRFGIDRGIAEDDELWLWVSLVAVAGVLTGSFTAFRRFYAFREARWTETRLREQLFGHIQSLHIGYHDRAQTGQLMSRSSSDLNQIQNFVVMIPITMSNAAMIVAVAVILFDHRPVARRSWRSRPLPLVNVAGRRFSESIHPAVLARAGGAGRSRRPWSRRPSAGCGSSRASAPRACRRAKLRQGGRRHPARVDQGRADPGEVPAGDRADAAARPRSPCSASAACR